jgi:hypothetical protein
MAIDRSQILMTTSETDNCKKMSMLAFFRRPGLFRSKKIRVFKYQVIFTSLKAIKEWPTCRSPIPES